MIEKFKKLNQAAQTNPKKTSSKIAYPDHYTFLWKFRLNLTKKNIIQIDNIFS